MSDKEKLEKIEEFINFYWDWKGQFADIEYVYDKIREIINPNYIPLKEKIPNHRSVES